MKNIHSLLQSGTATCRTTATWNLRSLLLKDAVWSEQNRPQKTCNVGSCGWVDFWKSRLGYMSSYGQKMMFVMLHVPVCWNPTKPLVSLFHCSTCLASLIATVNVTMNMQEVGDGHCFWWIFLYVNKTTWLMQYHCSIIFRTISQLWVDDVFQTRSD